MVVVACEVALEAAHRLDAALALGFLAGEVGAGLRVDAPAGDRDDVQGAVELAVAAAIEAVAILPARGDGDRRDPCGARELSVAAKPSAPAVWPIRIAAQSGPQPVSASNCGWCWRIRSRSSRLSASASRVSVAIRLTWSRAIRTLALGGIERSRLLMR